MATAFINNYVPATSRTLPTDEVELQSWTFQMENGNTEEISIVDPLIDSAEIATERAKSEFLKNAYRMKNISFASSTVEPGAFL